LDLGFSFRVYIKVPGKFCFLAKRPLAGLGGKQRRGGGRIPVTRLAGGEGPGMEEVEGSESYLLVVRVGLGVAGGGGSTGAVGRWLAGGRPMR